MTAGRLVLVCALVGLSSSCGSDHRTRSGSAGVDAVALRPTPPAALALCRRLALLRPTCPRRVPVGRYAHARRPPGYKGVAAEGAIAVCADARSRGVSITSRTCTEPSWILEVGAPAGLPLDAPPGLPGKRLPEGRRTRPPKYVHIIVSATRGTLAPSFPFAWPAGLAVGIRDSLLRQRRAKPVLLGSPVWSGRRGTLVLAPPLAFGGENGDHLIFRWKRAGLDYTVSMHSWAPLREAVATLRAVVVSARG
jgi:hypothetical protein